MQRWVTPFQFPLVSISHSLSPWFLSLPPLGDFSTAHSFQAARPPPADAARCPQQQPATKRLGQPSAILLGCSACQPPGSTFQPPTGALAGWGSGLRPATGQGTGSPFVFHGSTTEGLQLLSSGALLVASVVLGIHMAPDLEEDFRVVLQAARSRTRVNDLSSELLWEQVAGEFIYYAFAINSFIYLQSFLLHEICPQFDLA